MRRILAALGLVAVSSGSVGAQSRGVTPGWAAFAGCWIPLPADARISADSRANVCVVPTAGTAAELVTILDDKAVDRTQIDADGVRHAVDRQGCRGWESAEFSADGRRLFLRGEQECIGGTKRSTSGIFALAQNGDWINAVNVGADSANSVRVSRYAPSSIGLGIPGDVRSTLESRAISDNTARVSARVLVTTNAVIEASRFLTAPVVEAWLAELDQHFSLDERKLITLADAGVPPSVIDVMIAVSNPDVFSVRSTGSGMTTAPSDSIAARRVARAAGCAIPIMDPWAYYAYDPCDPYNRYSFYLTRRYGYRFDPHFGYASYDPFGYGYDYGRPVVIVVRGSANDPDRGHGKMTKDGYTRGTSTSTGTAEATTSRGTSSSDKGSSSGGGSSTRTATRKPPAD